MTDNSGQAGPMDVIARNKATARRVFEEAWDNANYNALNDLFVQDVQIFHQRMYLTKTIAETIPAVKAYHAAIPDLKMRIDQQVAEGNTVVNILTLHGTHTGEPFKTGPKVFEPNGKKVTQKRIIVHQFNDDGKIVEVLSVHHPMSSEDGVYE